MFLKSVCRSEPTVCFFFLFFFFGKVDVGEGGMEKKKEKGERREEGEKYVQISFC